jgi:hypothetical protein
MSPSQHVWGPTIRHLPCWGTDQLYQPAFPTCHLHGLGCQAACWCTRMSAPAAWPASVHPSHHQPLLIMAASVRLRCALATGLGSSQGPRCPADQCTAWAAFAAHATSNAGSLLGRLIDRPPVEVTNWKSDTLIVWSGAMALISPSAWRSSAFQYPVVICVPTHYWQPHCRRDLQHHACSGNQRHLESLNCQQLIQDTYRRPPQPPH